MKRLSFLLFLLMIVMTIAALWTPGLATAAPLTVDDPCMMTITTPGPEKPAATIPPPEGVFFQLDLEKHYYTGGARHLIWDPSTRKPAGAQTVTNYYYRNSTAMVMANNSRKWEAYRTQWRN